MLPRSPWAFLTAIALCSACMLGCGGSAGSPAGGGGAASSSPAPAIAALSPAAIAVGSPATTLTVRGSGFVAASLVLAGGKSLQTTYVSTAEVTAAVPASDLAAQGSLEIAVANPTAAGGKSSPVQLPITGVALDVSILDLPPGVDANVTVTLPSGSAVQLTSSGVVGGPAGAYQISAAPVPVASGSYYALQPTQAISAGTGQSPKATVDYRDAVPSTTAVVTQSEAAGLAVSPRGTTVTLPASSGAAASLQLGDVLAIGVTPATPFGLLRKVTSVAQEGSVVVATTTQGTLAEAFRSASFSYREQLAPRSFRARALRPGVRLIRPPRRQRRLQAASGTGAPADPCAANDVTFVQLISVPIVTDSAGTLTATGSIQVCPALQFSWQIGGFPPELQSLSATASIGGDLHVNLTGRYDQSFSQEVPILTLESEDPITVLIGPVPLVITPTLTFFVGASGNVTVGFSAGVTQTASVTAGIDYSNGQASPVFNTASGFGTDPPGIDGGFSAKGFAGVTIDLEIDGVLSPELSPDAFLQMAVSPAQNPWWTLTGGLEGSGKVGVGIFGFANLADISFPNLFQYSVPIASAGGAFAAADAAPTLVSLQPNAAPIGAQGLSVVVTGTNFVPGSTVDFSGTAVPTTFTDPDHLTANLSATQLASAGSFPITVENPDTPGAVSAPASFTVSGSVTNPAPQITSLSPASAVLESGAQTLTISGQNFLSTSAVTFAGAQVPAAFVNSGQITASIPAGDLASPGTFAVVVTNPAPGGGASNATDFTVANPAPVISSLNPNSAVAGSGAQTITIAGSGFLSTSAVSFNGSAIPTTYVSGSDLTAELSAADLATVAAAPVIVTNPAPGGGASNALDFVVSATSAAPLTISPATATVPVGGAQTFAASGSDASGGVTWTITQGSAGGTLATSSANSAVYSPPATTGTFQIVAASVADPSQTAAASVTVTAELPLTVLHSFSGPPTGGAGADGAGPFGGLAQGSNGDLYGTTAGGGTSGMGTAFMIDPSGNVTVLHAFSGPVNGGPDGAYPTAGLVQGVGGDLYGTTGFGGTSGLGTAFMIDPSGNETVLHSFSGPVNGGPDGASPDAGLVQAADGDLYGTTLSGGASGGGTVFMIDPSGNETVLHSFSGPDGDGPFAGLIEGSNGDLYGTTVGGGASDAGTVFMIDPSGNETVIYSFPITAGGTFPDGVGLFGGLVQGSSGDLYGTTLSGGTSGDGTVFMIDPSGHETVLHSFSGPDGDGPYGELVLGSDGNLYGTTTAGGALGDGTVFMIDPSGNETVLHSFTGADGDEPTGALVLDGDGNLYGTTVLGGTDNDGVVFRLDLPALPGSSAAARTSATPGAEIGAGASARPESSPARIGAARKARRPARPENR